MPALVPPLVVYTDLDGTLLDHHSYDFSPAVPMLRRLERLAIPVVLVTSKTRAEVSALRLALGNPHPYVVENGAVMLVPQGYFQAGHVAPVGPQQPVTAHTSGPSREALQTRLADLRARRGFRYRSFAELGAPGISEHTGLTLDAARLADQREGSEPLLWEDTQDALASFAEDLRGAGLDCVRGGRFVHVMGATDKAAAVRALHARYERSVGRSLERVVLGDGPNDLDMLADADVAVVVRGAHPHAMVIREPRGSVIHTEAPGPEGWREAMAQVLESRAPGRTGE